MESFKKKRKLLITVTAIALALVLTVGLCAVYVLDYYRADMAAIDAFKTLNEPEYKTVKNTVVFEPEGAKTGFIFYPGGKVDYLAYLPLMEACASNGVLCVLVKMPCNLAVLDMNAADGIKDLYPNIEKWYIGGHSLGGSMAASYLAKNPDDFDGLILLGSYSTADLSSLDIKVLSVYGSEDRVMDKEKYGSCKVNMPEAFSETVIEGGCHAYFGMYGAQEGDGEPTVSNAEQINLTANVILQFI